jgi:hypothetical protein
MAPLDIFTHVVAAAASLALLGPSRFMLLLRLNAIGNVVVLAALRARSFPLGMAGAIALGLAAMSGSVCAATFALRVGAR